MFVEFFNIILKSIKLDKSLYSDKKNYGEASIYYSIIIILLTSLINIVPGSAFLNHMNAIIDINDAKGPSIRFILIISFIVWVIKTAYLYFIGVVIFAGYIIATGINSQVLLYALLIGGLIYGILFVLPIGGADMPVVISLLNSLTGIAAAITGVLYNNMVMLVGGILVGSAGIILTVAMCKAMNRTLGSVIFGSFGSESAGVEGANKTLGTIKSTTSSDAAIMMNYATNVIIVPGYGLAVAQAQHVIHELEEILTDKGITVKYAIHPVAGRMPGHMNVLLAESNVEYNMLVEMDDINPQFNNADVVLVVGANDVVNPAAHNDPASPIYGMPILDVENAKHIVVNKRTMNAGYAGIENELFYNSKTSMLFGDAKAALTDLVSELKGM